MTWSEQLVMERSTDGEAAVVVASRVHCAVY